jgi:hypothetical protein
MNAPAKGPPVIGLDSGVAEVSDALRGLGIHMPMLTPVRWLIVTLGLHPSQSFVLDDDDGPGLALVAWRTEYETSEYHLPWPMLRGSAVAIRNDLFVRLLAIQSGRGITGPTQPIFRKCRDLQAACSLATTIMVPT